MTTENALPTDSAEGLIDLVHQRLSEASLHSEQLELRQLNAALAQAQQQLEGLRVAMSTRGVIEQAKGMLMLREQCDADTAFAMLVDLSQHSHRKLIDVARSMVEAWSAGEQPGLDRG